MANFETAQGTEGIVANAKQEAFNLQNEAAFNNPVDLSIAAYTPSITKESMANAFKDNEDWRSFLADEKRYIKKDAPHSYKAFRQIEDMWRKPEFASIVDMYGTDMAVAGQMLSDYVDWDKVPWWEKQKIGIRAARYGMKINDARNDVIQLEHDGADPATVAEAKQRLAGLEEYFQHNARPYDSGTANALASFGVSFARVVPEMVLTSAVLAAALPSGGATAGAAAVGAGRIAALLSNAGRAANIARGLRIARQAPKIAKGINLAREGVQGLASAGIVYNDTYRVTMGEVYDKLKSEHPEMSDEQLYEMSDTVSSLSAALEAAPTFVGLGFRAASSTAIDTALRSVVTKVPQDVLQRAKFMRVFQEGVNKSIGKKIAAGWTADAVTDTMTEVIQEAAENAALTIANGEGSTDSIIGETLLRVGGFLINPLDEKYASELDTLLTTLPAAALFGGVGPTVSYAGHRLSQRDSIGKTMSDFYRNSKFGSDLHAFTQENIDKMGAGAIKEMITGMGNRGDAPTSVYFDKAALQNLMDTDSEFRTSMERLGVLKQMEESEGNGGVIEVPLAEYNEVVNGDKSGTLYSKVKDMVTFQIDALTQSQFNEWLSSVETQNQAEIKAAIENEGSVYNRVLNEYLNQPMFEKMTDAQRKANASLMQLVANRAVQSMAKPMTAEEWFEQNVVLTQGTEEQAINGLQQTTEKTLDNANQPANIEAQGVTNGEQSAIRQIRRAIRQGNDSDVWVDTSTGDQTAGRVEGSRLLSFTDKAKQALASEGNAAPNFIVYENAEAGAQDFLSSMEAAVAKLGEFAASVDVKELSDYKNMKALILSEDKQTGCAVTQDGDIVSLFSCSAERRRTPAMLLMAVRQGGKKLDCFDIYLPKLYSEVGFKAVARNHWNEEYKPAGWNKTLFKGYNKGEPDVVFMVYDPTSQAIYQQGDGVLIEGKKAYDEGMAAQDKALQQIEAQQLLKQAQDNLQIVRKSLFQRLYQSAYAGSKVDYDRPSLEAIGSGEGYQAHGWGLYYALNPEIAEKYRMKLSGPSNTHILYKGQEIPSSYASSYSVKQNLLYEIALNFDSHNFSIKDTIDYMLKHTKKEIADWESYIEKGFAKENPSVIEDRIAVLKESIKELESFDLKDFKKSVKGQVHKVEIPEMNVLLDEQEAFNKQSPYIKKALERMLYDDAFKQFHQTDAEDFAEIELTDWELGFSGGNIYDRISNLLGSDKAASQLMEKYGIKGITYDGRQDGRCFVIFNPDDVQVIQKKFDELGNELFQKNKEVIAGWFDVQDDKYIVGLTDKWNTTTFSHEVFHLYSRVLQDNYNSGAMTSYWKAQTEKLFKTVDAKPQVDPADPTVSRYFLTRNQEELLAERFTTYLLDNKIENPELNSIFALLRDAFDKTYKQLDMTKHTPDKKTKEAFAVIFGSQDVATAEQRALGLLEIEKPANVSQEAYDKYMSFLLESRAKASHDMIKTYYRIEKYRKSKEYAEAYDAAYTANLQVAEKEPFAQVKALAKELGTDDVSALLLAYNSTHGDAILTADDVVGALNDPTTPTQVAEQRTAEVMEDLIKEKFNTKEGDTLVAKDVRNAAMAKAFLMEAMMYEGKDDKTFQDEYSKLLADVDNQVQKMPLSKLQNNRRWQQLEGVYAQQYQMYMATGNQEKAAMVRRAQAQVVLIQNTMFEMNNRVDRFLTKFPKKLRTAQPANQNTMTAESWDLLQSLMEKYGFKITDKRRSADSFNIKLDNWLKNIETSEFCPISNLRYFLPETKEGHSGSFGSMKVRQFEVLEHVANAINSVASREYNLITEAEKVKYDTLVALTAARFRDKNLKPFEKDDGWWRKHFGILSNIVNPEPIMKALFPEEVHQKLVRPLFSAASRAETDFNKWDAKWNDMIKKINASNKKKLYSTGHELSYNNVVNLLLAMGTEHAYENWRLFLKMDEAQAEAVVAEALKEQPQLAEFANAYWAMMAETTDLMNDSYRKRYNKLFVKKEPRAFKIGGYEFTGGYVPESKLVSALPENAQWESIVMGELSNEKLLSDKPDGRDLQSIVDNTRSRLRLFARWGHVAPEFNNFVRFVQREDVGAIIGSRAQNYIKGWLRDYHTPAGDSAGLMHALMAATTTTVLGVRLPQALLQLSGLIPAMGILGRGGIRYMVSALGRSLANGGVHQVEYARSLPSDYMKARYADPTKTLFGVSKTEAHISKTVDKFQKIAMAGISYVDAIVANATWEASYRMAKDNGLTHEEAIEQADQNVRLSQTDSLTISRSRAMKSDWARIITPFSTYMMGMQSVVRGRIAEKEFYGAFGFAISYIVGSTIFEAALKEIPMPWDDEDDKDYVERILKRWYNDAISTAGSTLYPIAGLGSDTAKSFAWALEKILYPDEQTVIDMWGGGSLAALSYAKQYPDALRYGLVGIFNGDEDAQRKAVANMVGWVSAGGKRMVKDLMED